jgi:predicted amidohydrolase
MVSGKVKVAAIQDAPESYNLAASLAHVESLAIEAAKAGAKLVVFPEAFLSGYPRHTGFSIGSRSDEDREWYRRYVEVCLPPKVCRKTLIVIFAHDRAR